MNRVIALFFAIAVVLCLAGCTAAWRDVSYKSEYAAYIGQTYKLKNKMEMRGIGHREEIYFYMLNKLNKVQHKSPEEVSSQQIAEGTTFTITGVQQCANCLDISDVHRFTIAMPSFKGTQNIPVTIPEHEIRSGENVTQLE